MPARNEWKANIIEHHVGQEGAYNVHTIKQCVLKCVAEWSMMCIEVMCAPLHDPKSEQSSTAMPSAQE